MHLPGSGPAAPRPAGVTGGSRRQSGSPKLETRRSWRRRPGGRGQSLVEFGLILPVVLLMTVGIIDVARLFAAEISLTNGVREAALYAAAGGLVDLPGIADHINGEAAGMDKAQIVIEPPVCDTATCDSTSTTVRITASYPFRPFTPIIDLIMGSQLLGHAGLGRAVWITASVSTQMLR